MSNMSYCRFQNTAADLEDCRMALERFVRGEAEGRGDTVALSERELEWAKDLVATCLQVATLVAEAEDCELEDVETKAGDILDRLQQEATEIDEAAADEEERRER